MTPNEFPYIKSIHVNDCFAYQNFDIDLPPLNGKPFSHLILTGKNGSGKTTILESIEATFMIKELGLKIEEAVKNIRKNIRENSNDNNINIWIKNDELLENIVLNFNLNESYLNPKRENYIFSFLKAMRTVQTDKVTTIVNDESLKSEFRKDKSSDFFISKFKQYLVNKKVAQAFDQIKGNTEGVKSKNHFFDRLEKVLKDFYEDDFLKLTFEERNYEFYINLKNNRQITFNQLPNGFASFTSILMDLYIRLDIIQANIGDYTYEPCGIVLLDEPEAHLHIKAQYEVLPILTEFFPNVQFIVATHSPAVISSIKNTTIFDLTSQQSITDEAVGSSFSELMVTHFGLDNEFSPIADEIIDNVEKAVKETKTNKPLLKQKLQEILKGNERYLSPTLRLELESLILENS